MAGDTDPPTPGAVRIAQLGEHFREATGAAVGSVRVFARLGVWVASRAENRAVAFGDELIEVVRSKQETGPAGPQQIVLKGRE
jgi:hypothetical protein